MISLIWLALMAYPCIERTFSCTEPTSSWEESGGPSTSSTTTWKGTGSIPIEMVGAQLFDDQIDQLWTVSEVEIDPLDYPGITNAYFEAVMDNGTSAVEKSIYLVDEDGTYYGTLTSPIPDYYRIQPERRSTAITLNASKKKYYAKTHASLPADSLDLNFRTARIRLNVEDSERLKLQVPMLDGDSSTGGGYIDVDENNLWAYAVYTDSATYGYNVSGADDKYFRLFQLTKSNWDTIDHWTFEAIGCVYDVDGTASVALFNYTKNAMVSGTELTFTGLLPERKTVDFSDAAENWDDGDEYEVRIKYDKGPSNWGYAYVYRSALYATLEPVKKFEVHQRVGSCTGGLAAGSADIDLDGRYDTDARCQYQSDLFPDDTPVYFEGTAKETGTVSSLYLYDCDTSDGGALVVTKSGTISTTVSGTWTNPDYILEQDNRTARLDINVAGTYRINVTGFDFSSIPDGANINSVDIETIVGSYGQTVEMGAKVDSGTDQHTHVVPNWAEGELILVGQLFSIGTMTKDQLNAATLSVYGKTSNTISTICYWDWAGLRANIGTIVTQSQLDFASTRERKRTADLSSVLVLDHRYVTYVSAIASPVARISSHSSYFIIAEGTGKEVVSQTSSGTGTTPPPCVDWSGGCDEPTGDLSENPPCASWSGGCDDPDGSWQEV